MLFFRQLLEAETLCTLFHDNVALCSEVTESVVQHAVRCIETHGRHMQYLKFLQTIVKSENTYIRKCQDMVMSEVMHDPRTHFMYWPFLAFHQEFAIVPKKAMKSGGSKVSVTFRGCKLQGRSSTIELNFINRTKIH